MASIRLQPPEPFVFKRPDEWPRWKKRFQQFRSASTLDKEAEDRQVNTLLYCMGEEAENVLSSTGISDDDKKKYDKVMEKFDLYFAVRRNVIFERARFNRRVQHEGESAEVYISELYELIEFCDYGNLKDEMLRDRLVVGIRDTSLSEKMQTDPALTLEKAKTMIRQREAVREQRRELEATDTGSTVEGVTRGTYGRRTNFRQQKPQHPKGGAETDQPTTQCTRCGYDKHKEGQKCPARSATCNKCNRKGHFSAKCFSKTVALVTSTEGGQLETAFLDVVNSQRGVPWMSDIQLQGETVRFKLDTGAEVTAISTEAHQQIGSPKLSVSSKVLYGPARQTLNVLGQFQGTLRHGECTFQETISVVDGLRTNLLGLQAITAL